MATTNEPRRILARIVNKNGARGALTLSSDDGDQRTADFFYSVMAPSYPAFRMAIAMPTKKIASLSLTPDGSAWQKDENGKYRLTVLENCYCSEIEGSVFARAERHPSTVDFWKQIVTCDAIELFSHSHTHAAWGLTDEQNPPYPKGNVIKELHASAQILRDLIGEPTPLIMRPGGHSDMTSDYFYELVGRDETYFCMRGGSGPAPLKTIDRSLLFSKKLNTPTKFQTPLERLRIATIDVRSYEAALSEDGSEYATKVGASAEECIFAGVSAWTNYVDLALQNGCWASIGFHGVVPDTAEPQKGYSVFDSQVKALFDYLQPLVEGGELWIPDSFTEAAKYYFEWSSASLDAKAYGEDRIELSLTAGEDEHLGERLTVEVPLPDFWEAAELTSYGSCERLTPRLAADGSRFVYVGILPGKEISVLRRIP